MVAFIAGLGNPGTQYAATRHNIGHMVVDELARRAGTTLALHKKTNTQNASVRLGSSGGVPGPAAMIAKPLSYMNVSGGPVSALAKYLSVEPTDVIVVHDELDIPFGTIKLKRGGGEGGHNGLRDITKALGTKEYLRVRVGIGRPPGSMGTADYVLKPFTATERKDVPWLIDAAADAVELLVAEGLEAAQLKYHTAP